jgi:superfamily II DNA or RNA helicase
MFEAEKAQWSDHKRLSSAARSRIADAQRRRWLASRGLAAASAEPSVPEPSPSVLSEKLSQHLGRQLRKDEANLVGQLQTLFAKRRQLTESELGLIAGRFEYGWKPLKLWHDFPSNDFFFWLHIAWELRRRSWQYPPFMAGITDLHLIEPAMRELECEKAIQEWKGRFGKYETSAPLSDSSVVELRLVLGPKGASFQWRGEGSARFCDVKQAQANRMAAQFEQGALTFTPDSLALWTAAYRPWNGWWSLQYTNADADPGLGRLLRMPFAPDRVVTDDGQPLARIPEPLRLTLRCSEQSDGNYELALVTSEGSPPPRILCTFAGRPTLYLTEGGLFSGPPADVLEAETSKQIPAAALESAGAIRFLYGAGIAMPEHLAKRVRTLPVRVTISCALKAVSSKREDIVLRIMAQAPGLKSAMFTPTGWQEDWRDQAKGKSKSAHDVVVVHDFSAQKYFPRVIDSLDLKWESYSGEWSCRLTKQMPGQFVAWLESLPAEIEVLLDKELATLRDAPVSGDVSLDIEEASIDWFDLKVALKVSDTTLTAEELQVLLNARGGYVRLGKRGWRRLEFNFTPEDDEQLARLGLDARDFSAEPQRFHALQLADAAAKRFLTPERVEAIERRTSELKLRVTPALSSAIHAAMRPYQTEGFHFLAYLTSNRFGGVLADDMGLGKTLQTLAWLAWLRQTTGEYKSCPLNPSLVVCPKSVMDNWRTEAERFYPSLRVRLWRGEPVAQLSAARADSDLIVINYAQLRSLSPEIASLPWLAAILDEAQYIKNPNSQTAQAACSLRGEYRLGLTGTPIENRLLDLWSIFAFAMPGVLGDRAQFVRRFDGKDDPLACRRLAARVRPFLLRRTKAQVEKELPDRVEEDLLCEMEGGQKTLYSAELKRARQLILGLKTPAEFNRERFHILTSLLRLRQICCHPALVDRSLREAESAKMAALEDLLEPLIEEGHKTLVFSQFVNMLDLLRENVEQHGWPCFYLSGETEDRGELIRQFQSAPGGAVFLISLKAGGFGLNLTAASYVVLFDPWWNPAVENQAIDRTHRIGQTSKVIAYRLLIRDSIEQKVRALQRHKAALAEDVLGEERFAQTLTLQDLRFLFADGADDFHSAIA